MAGMPHLSTFFVIEDGYIALTVAHNIAVGLGMSVSDGTVSTNGVQPLIKVLFTLPYAVHGRDKIGGLYA